MNIKITMGKALGAIWLGFSTLNATAQSPKAAPESPQQIAYEMMSNPKDAHNCPDKICRSHMKNLNCTWSVGDAEDKAVECSFEKESGERVHRRGPVARKIRDAVLPLLKEDPSGEAGQRSFEHAQNVNCVKDSSKGKDIYGCSSVPVLDHQLPPPTAVFPAPGGSQTAESP